MARKRQRSSVDQPDIVEDLRRRDQPTPDAPATVPHPGEDDVRPDGGVAEHPVHDDDAEDLGPEDYERLTDEVEQARRKPR